MMMHYGYSLVYKDIQGFILPYDTSGYCKVFNEEASAERELSGLKDYLNCRLSTRIKSVEHQIVPRRWWFQKVVAVTTYYSDDELKSLRQIINTLHVKRVKLA